MSSILVLRGVDIPLSSVAVDVFLAESFVAVTVSAMSGEGDGDMSVFSHTHLIDLAGMDLESVLGSAGSEAVEVFKSALADQGGVIVSADESREPRRDIA